MGKKLFEYIFWPKAFETYAELISYKKYTEFSSFTFLPSRLKRFSSFSFIKKKITCQFEEVLHRHAVIISRHGQRRIVVPKHRRRTVRLRVKQSRRDLQTLRRGATARRIRRPPLRGVGSGVGVGRAVGPGRF